MAITAERFADGMTFADYKAQMACNRERLEAHEQTVVLAAADVAFFVRLPRPLHVLVLTEDWCEPAIAAIPVLARLAAACGMLDLRLFLRDQHPDLMDQYLNGGVHRTIPTFVVLDHDLRELGRWVERPARIAELGHAMLQDLFAHDPVLAAVPARTPLAQLPEAAQARVMEAFARFGAETRDLFERELVGELRVMVEAVLHAPIGTDWTSMTAGCFPEQRGCPRGQALDPAIGRAAVNEETVHGEPLDDTSIAQAIVDVPAHSRSDHVVGKATVRESTR